MDSLLSVFLLFVAAVASLLTYIVVPSLPVVALVFASAILLAAGVWWHWTQFAIDYRASTWQENLRNYASYALVAVVILITYAFYVFLNSDAPTQAYVSSYMPSLPSMPSLSSNSRNAGRNQSLNILQNMSEAATNILP